MTGWRTIRQRTAVFRSMRKARTKATRAMLNFYAAKRGARLVPQVGRR